MDFLYTVLYVNVDDHLSSEVYGIYHTKEEAVDKLLQAANFREEEGKLTQYRKVSYEYDSMTALRELVNTTNQLVDVDIYRIDRIPMM